MHIDFKGSGDTLCLRLTLTAQDVVEVFENRHLLRDRIGKIVLIHLANAAVDDGLFHRLQPVLAAHNQLTHGEDEVRLQSQRVFLFRVVHIDVQRVDVVGAYRRDADDLTAELLHKGIILRLGIADDDVIFCDEEGVGHFPLR